MKTIISALSFLLIPTAFAMTLPSAVLDQMENDIIPRVKASSEFKLTKIARTNSAGRLVPKGTCIFSNGDISLSIEYCDMANPQAQRLELKDSISGEEHELYLERNSATQLPHFRFTGIDESGMCLHTSFYGDPRCHDSMWMSELSNYRSYNAFSEASPEKINFIMNFASRIESIDKVLRVIARSRP